MAVCALTNISINPLNKSFSATVTVPASTSASAVYCGFTPKTIKMIQIAGTPGNLSRTSWFNGMTNAYYVREVAAGDLTIQTSAGYTPLTGGEVEATLTAKATGSPLSAGPGFIIGTGPQEASMTYYLIATG